MRINVVWVLLVLAIPFAEVFSLLQVGRVLGVLPTIGLILLMAILGITLIRVQGALMFRRLAQSLAHGQLPAREVLDAAALLVVGVLLLIPGFFTDVLGFLLLIPPFRHLLYGLFFRRVQVSGSAAGRPVNSGEPIEGVYRRDDP